MWGSLLGFALLIALNPVRLGLILLVISRPRPMHNLLAYWVGSLTACISTLVVPLMLLHVTTMFGSFAPDMASPATSSTVRHVQLAMGVLALSIAALVTVRSLARRRQRAQLPTPGGNTSTVVLDSNKPTAIARLLGHTQDAPTEDGSAIQRLLRRVHNAWENGSLWVAYAIGFLFGGLAPLDGIYVFAIIVGSGAAIGTQVSAAIAVSVALLAVVEITLISYLATPAKTQAIVRLLHNWALDHRRQIVVAMCIVAGVALVAQGL